jgi:uncharacterized membrane protein SpoIIM required for sporulation
MKETSFIEQNKEKWKRFQELAARKEGDPEELADLYSDITDDLSYAQTFYNRRTVRVYLNQIAQGIHNLVHKERGESLKKFFTVWRVSLPLEIYRSRRHLLFALCITLFWAALGAVSTVLDPDFPRTVMGDFYVDQTFRNIANGTPLDVYRDDSQLAMFFTISVNNIKVSFYCFIFGFFFTIGTHILLFSNGVMLGAFQTMFYTKGVLLTAFLGIWIHGAFEISCVVIAGGAGITMGNGWLFPGSYTRLQSLQLSARRGLKIMMSLVPFLFMAGFLESYVTHNYQLFPEWSKWALIMFCFSIILFYFVFYPMYVAYKYPELVHEQHVVNHRYKERFNMDRLRTFGQMFSDTFAFYRVHIGKVFKINAVLSLPLIVLMIWLQDVQYYDQLTMQHWYDWSAQLRIIMGCRMENGQDLLVMLGWTVVFTILASSVLYCFANQEKSLDWKKWFAFLGKKFFGIWMCNSVIYLFLLVVSWYWLMLIVFILPFIWLNAATFAIGDGTLSERVSNGFRFSARSYGNSILSIGVLCLIVFLFSQLIAFVGSIHDGQWMEEPPVPDLLDMLADFVKTVARSMEMKDFIVPSNIVRQIVYVIFIFLSFPLFVVMAGFIHGDISEKNTAKGLRADFSNFGRRRRNQETAVDFE